MRKTTTIGIYTITYRALSDDGHVVSGRIDFRVGAHAAIGTPAVTSVASTRRPTASLATPAIAVAIAALGLATAHLARRRAGSKRTATGRATTRA
jgi:hypothetical protein